MHFYRFQLILDLIMPFVDGLDSIENGSNTRIDHAELRFQSNFTSRLLLDAGNMHIYRFQLTLDLIMPFVDRLDSIENGSNTRIDHADPHFQSNFTSRLLFDAGNMHIYRFQLTLDLIVPSVRRMDLIENGGDA